MALVGESGCGKSVSALSIMGLIPYPPGRVEAGEAWFEGRDLLELDNDEMQRVRGGKIAMVFQEPMTSLNPVLSIERQLTEAIEIHLGMDRKMATEQAVDLMARVGITDPEQRLRQYPHQFSGGMRQRIMIAMALSCSPRLIIADEPTTAVDVTIQAQLLALMKRLTRELGVSLILITHNLGVVARYADNVNIMYAGRIIEHGSAKDIYAHPRHPYTIGLLNSVPRLDQPKKEMLDPIEGQPPDLANLKEGCAFRERCQYAIARCSEEYPPFEMVGENHRSACWVADSLEGPR
jgi:oligopeptide/dipeptide ABC transporter ATP-binding protein